MAGLRLELAILGTAVRLTSEDTKRYKLWSCQNVCEALIYLLDNIYIRFGTKLYRQIVGIPMGTNCAPLVADLFLFCYERDFMTSLSDVKQAEIIEAFKSTSRYLDEYTYLRIGYNINIMRQSACLVFNPITVNNFAFLFNCMPVGRASDSMMAPT